MELVGAISMGEWSSLSGMYTSEEANFNAHELFAQCSVPNESSNLGLSSSFCPGHEFLHMAGIGSHYSSEIDNSYLYSLSQESCQSGGGSIVFPASSNENFYLSECHPTLGIHYNGFPTFCSGDCENTNLFLIDGYEGLHPEVDNDIVEESGRNHPEPFAAESNFQLKWDAEMTVPDSAMENKNPPGSSKKRCRNPVEVQKNKRNVRSRKSLKLVLTSDNEEDGNGGTKGQSSSSCCTGDDSNTYQEPSEGVTPSSSPKGTTALNLIGKARATRGSGTDPQSVYARKRREKINERLRILQNLVPNGTKVDISTMLEEAVQYVKFLQLQIKLLSSDDLWMYAPIAYNGMNIGLDLRIANPKPT